MPTPTSHPAAPLKAIVPVLDILSGTAVHAVRGERQAYRPLGESFAGSSDPLALAVQFAQHFDRLYLADLDAIAGAKPNWRLYRRLAQTGLECWIDFGCRSAQAARQATRELASDIASVKLVIGLETLPAIETLTDIAHSTDPDSLLFSLDLKQGRPMHPTTMLTPLKWVSAALAAGVSRIIVLDLAVVGTGAGPAALPLCRQLAREYPKSTLYLGGGVRTLDDVAAALDAGCHGALVGTSLHSGRIKWQGEA